jgi:hypothetical protein
MPGSIIPLSLPCHAPTMAHLLFPAPPSLWTATDLPHHGSSQKLSAFSEITERKVLPLSHTIFLINICI